jgi:peptide-methionine (S)-S-oxide reductase
VVSYHDLLETFWLSHDATRPSHASQYASMILAADESQLREALESRDRFEARIGRPVSTRIEPLRRFWPAEDYHQKYYLRNDRVLAAEFLAMYPDDADLRESPAAARVNGYLGGSDSRTAHVDTLTCLGLSVAGRDRLLSMAVR